MLGTLITILTLSRTGFRKTDTVLNRLIRGAIQTGLFAGIFSLGDLITFVRLPTTNLYGMFAIPIGRIYTNVSVVGAMRAAINKRLKTLLDTLLSREELKAQMAGTYDIDLAVRPIGGSYCTLLMPPSERSDWLGTDRDDRRYHGAIDQCSTAGAQVRPGDV
jgi:hypothetical protein